MSVKAWLPEASAYEYSIEWFQIFSLCFFVEYELNAESLDLSDIVINYSLRES